MIKSWLIRNQYRIFLVVVIAAMLFIVSCTTGSGNPAPSGPIGGGCG